MTVPRRPQGKQQDAIWAMVRYRSAEWFPMPHGRGDRARLRAVRRLADKGLVEIAADRFRRVESAPDYAVKIGGSAVRAHSETQQ